MEKPNYQNLLQELQELIAVREAAIRLALICREGRQIPCPANCPGEMACGINFVLPLAPGADLTPLVRDY